MSQQGQQADLGVLSLIQVNGAFSKDGDIGASQPAAGLMQCRLRWNKAAAKHAALVKETGDSRKEQLMAHLLVTACCMRAWFAGQELLQPGWIGPATKSGCDKIACCKIRTFQVQDNEQPRRVRPDSRLSSMRSLLALATGACSQCV